MKALILIVLAGLVVTGCKFDFRQMPNQPKPPSGQVQ